MNINLSSKQTNSTEHNTCSKGIKTLSNETLETYSFLTLQFKKVIDNIKSGNVIETHTLSPTPEKFKLSLKLHQKRTLHEMIYKESLNYRVSNGINMFILSDKVGSGKSIDILALLTKYPTLSDTKYLNINNIIYDYNDKYTKFKGFQMKPSIILKTNLIVIPHNIFNQWHTYITTCTQLSVYLINTRKKIKEIIFKDFIDGKYNILLVKSTMYNNLMDHIYSKYPKNIKTITKHSEYNDIIYMNDLSSKLLYDIKKLKYNERVSAMTIKINFANLKNTINNININTFVDNLKSYSKKLDYISVYEGPIFDRVIFDEANSIKIPRCRIAYGKINWFITSSVENLLRPYGYWSNDNSNTVVNGIHGSGFIKETFINNSSRKLHRFIQDIYIKNKDTFIVKSFNLPEPIKHIIKCWTPPELKILQGIALPEVIHALNAGDISTAISLTNCNISNQTDIIDTTLHVLQTKLNTCNQVIEEKTTSINSLELIIQLNNPDEDALLELKKQKKNIKQSLKLYNSKKKDLEFKLNSLKERISDINIKSCPICTSVVENPCLTDCCKNIFCMACYVTALSYSAKKQCPHCRKPNRDISNLTLFNNINTAKKDTAPTLPKKLETLIEIIKNKPNGKFLVFSEYNASFLNILNKLKHHEIKYSKLSGSTGRITNIINQFSNDELKVLLLNAKHCGSGLNLQMATDIIIYHKMDNELEQQIIGRGQRLGRTNTLHIHYLYYEHEK